MIDDDPTSKLERYQVLVTNHVCSLVGKYHYNTVI